MLLVLEDYLRPKVRGVRRDKGLAFPSERKGKGAGGELDLVFQGVIEIHGFSPLAG